VLEDRVKTQDLFNKMRLLIFNGILVAEFRCRIIPLIRSYARASTDGQSVYAQVKRLRAAGAEKVYRETASRRAHPCFPLRLFGRRFLSGLCRFKAGQMENRPLRYQPSFCKRGS
jgi:hypothetical protein